MRSTSARHLADEARAAVSASASSASSCREDWGRLRRAQGLGQRRRHPSQSLVRDPHESRSQPGGRAKIRERIGQVPQQRQDVLDLVGVEEPEALVDVRRQTVPLERLLELAVALARAEEDRDVSGPDRPSHAGRSVTNERALANQPRDLGGRRLGAGFRRVAGQNRQRVRIVVSAFRRTSSEVRLKPDTTSSSIGNRSSSAY